MSKKIILGLFLILTAFGLFYIDITGIYNINLPIWWILNLMGSLVLVSIWIDLIKNRLVRIIVMVLVGFIGMVLLTYLQIGIYYFYIAPPKVLIRDDFS